MSGDTRKTNEQYIKECAAIGVTPLAPYAGGRTPIPHTCRCGMRGWVCRPDNVLSGRSCGCSRKHYWNRRPAKASQGENK